MKKKTIKGDFMQKATSKKQQNKKLHEYAKRNREKLGMTAKTPNRIADCGDFMQYVTDKRLENKKQVSGSSCENRFCPICSARKSKRNGLALRTSTEYLIQDKDYQLLHLVLTVPNCEGYQLKDTVKDISQAFNRFKGYKDIINMAHGMVRKLEVTYNELDNTYHPHLHILIAVDKSYFTNPRQYLKQQTLLNLWRKATRNELISQVSIQKVKDIEKGIAEITKYMAKDSNYLINEEVFYNFYKGLKGSREISYLGAFKEAKKLYDNGDLEQYLTQEIIKWYYLITNQWNNEEYKEIEITPLTESMARHFNLDDIDDELKEIPSEMLSENIEQPPGEEIKTPIRIELITPKDKRDSWIDWDNWNIIQYVPPPASN